jgi:hypothetical protein
MGGHPHWSQNMWQTVMNSEHWLVKFKICLLYDKWRQRNNKQKFVSTKWRIYKGILIGPRLLRRGISRGCRECELFFQLQSLQKFLYRDLKWKKSFIKWKKCQNRIYIQKSSFKNKFSTLLTCCASQNKTRKIKTNSNSIGMFYKYFNSFIIWRKFNNLFKLTQLLFIFFYVAWAWGNAFETIVFDDYLGNLQFIEN